MFGRAGSVLANGNLLALSGLDLELERAPGETTRVNNQDDAAAGAGEPNSVSVRARHPSPSGAGDGQLDAALLLRRVADTRPDDAWSLAGDQTQAATEV